MMDNNILIGLGLVMKNCHFGIVLETIQTLATCVFNAMEM